MKNSIKTEYRIKAPVEEVWKALVDPKYIRKWGGGPAKIMPRKGTKFSLWGGGVWGKNMDVVKNKKLVQEWLCTGWEKPSQVTFRFRAAKNGTVVSLDHKKIPAGKVKETKSGWKEYYFDPIKEILELK